MIWIRIEHDVVAIPQPAAHIVVIVRRNLEEIPANVEPIAVAAAYPPDVRSPNRPLKPSMLPRLIEMVMLVIAPRVVPYPMLILRVNMRRFCVPLLVRVSPPLLSRLLLAAASLLDTPWLTLRLLSSPLLALPLLSALLLALIASLLLLLLRRRRDRKSTRLNSSHQIISYAVFCLKKKIIILVRFLQQQPGVVQQLGRAMPLVDQLVMEPQSLVRLASLYRDACQAEQRLTRPLNI